MKIAIYSSQSYDKEYLGAAGKEYGYETEFFEASLNHKTAKLATGFDAVCAFVNDVINRQTLEAVAAEHIGIIALRCAGFNNVDLEAAHELGIRIMRVPAYSPFAVAEHAVSLILTLNRKTHKAYHRVRDSNFSLERLVGFDVHGKKVGIVGTGKIGQVFAGIMQGFGCNIIAYDPYPDESLASKGIVYVELDTIFSESDIISLHCPLTPDTYQLVNRNRLNLIKKGAMLINTSRGKLINTEAVIEVLRNKQLGYLGIDVYAEEEKLFFRDLSERIIDDEKIMHLMTFPNVLITAHQAFLTQEALTQIAATTMENIYVYSQGRTNENEVSGKNLV